MDTFVHVAGIQYAPRRVERLVLESGLRWTIVRPSMIYGSELDHNMHKLLRFLDCSPVYPVFGSGQNLWQPSFYEGLAQGVLASLERARRRRRKSTIYPAWNRSAIWSWCGEHSGSRSMLGSLRR